MKYKRGSGLDLPVINSVKPTVNKTKRAQNLSRMKIQFTKQRSRAGINSGTLDKILSKTKNPYSDLKATTAKGPKQYSSMAEIRKAKGFKPGESASQFNKRKTALSVAKKAASATTVGKIALGIGVAGVAAKEYLKGKKIKNENKKNLTDFYKQKKPGEPSKATQTKNKALNKLNKKMGGGMMQRPMGNTMMQQPMMQQPMGYKSGGMDTGRVGEMKSKIAVAVDRVKKAKKSMGRGSGPMGGTGRLTESDMKKIKSLAGVGKAAKPLKRNMGGMMMQRPMGYKHGTSVTAKCKLGRNKATKIT